MKSYRFLLYWALFLICYMVLTNEVQAAEQESVSYSEHKVIYEGKSFTIQYIEVDLKDPGIKVTPLLAEGGIGHVEEFDQMIRRSGAIAAVNGTFFNAYEQDSGIRYPNGLMIADGRAIHSGINQTLAIGLDKKAVIEHWEMSLKAHVFHEGQNIYSFTPWSVNKYFGAEAHDQVNWYSPEFGKQHIDYPGGSKIVICEGKIVEITEDEAQIPENGAVLFIGHAKGNIEYLLPHLQVGVDIQLEAALQRNTNGQSGSSDWLSAIGVGPKLITAGRIDIDPERDGFNDPKITSLAAVRSFVGINHEGKMVMGTTSAATLSQMGHILLDLGLVEAMNMDGGASSALYVNGKFVRPSGRPLSNAWIVQKLEQPQVQIFVNGQYVHDYRGYINGNTTMAPFRGIFERLEADFEWDNETRTLTAWKDNIQLILRPDDQTAYVNGESVTLDSAPVIIDGHIYIPLRFVTEALGATVEWDSELYRASIIVP